MPVLSKVKKLLVGTATDGRPLQNLSERDLINAESEIGRQLFGPIPEGHRREFFCLDENTWIWHEEWKDGRDTKVQTTRYEVRSTGIIKVSDGGQYKYVEGVELENLVTAMRLYYEQVMRGIYKIDPSTGRPLNGAE